MRPEEEEDEEREESEERQLDAQAQARRRVALAQIRQYPDAVLRMRAREVEQFDDDLARLADRMAHLMHDARGVGLAATQVGVLQRLFVFQAAGDEDVTAIVNPEITDRTEETEVADEGCLSLQGVLVPVERAARRHDRRAGRQGRAAAARARGDGRARRPARARPPRGRADARAHRRRVAPRGARHAAARRSLASAA